MEVLILLLLITHILMLLINQYYYFYIDFLVKLNKPLTEYTLSIIKGILKFINYNKWNSIFILMNFCYS